MRFTKWKRGALIGIEPRSLNATREAAADGVTASVFGWYAKTRRRAESPTRQARVHFVTDTTSCCFIIAYTHDSMSNFSAGIPSSFDPALLFSEYDRPLNLPAPISHSDDIDALQACIEEDKTKKNQQGVVIQHRAWNLADIFRSEGELGFGTARAIRRKYRY